MQDFHERYRVIERIGDGGIGAVFRVEDRTSGRTLAMKVLPRAAGSGGLRGEFLALARLRHDNVVSVLDYGMTRTGQDFFTMEYVVGPPLLEALPAGGAPGGADSATAGWPPVSFYQLVGGVLRALAFVHARGMVHADIKPSNILVDGARLAREPIKAARLADFGLAAHLSDPTAQAARGTLLYAAPEVLSGRLDARSDLYAVGVVLYQMLTGELPYRESTVAELLAAQRAGPPADPRTARPELPAGLAELVMGLLDPSPGARPQTADEVLARINEFAGTDFAIADSRPLIDVGGVLFGRARELSALDEMWREASAGLGGAALVRGEAGLGKSRLLAELKLQVELGGGRVIATSGRDRTLAGLVQEHAAGPRFARAEAAADALFEVAADGPLLLVVDDADHADPAAAEILAYLARAVAGTRVLVCLATGSDSSVADVGPERCLELAPLDRADLGHLVEHAFSADVARALTEPLSRASGGNPAHAARALEALVESGGLARQRGTWVLKDEAATDVPVPPDAEAAALARLERLGPDATRALAALTVVGESFDREMAEALCDEARIANEAPATGDTDGGPGRGLIDAILADAVALRLAWADAAAGRYQLTSPAVRRALEERLDPDLRLRLHRRAARLHEEQARAGVAPPAAEMAGHYLALEQHDDSICWARRAAEELARSQDPAGALEWYRRIEPLVAGAEAAALHQRVGDLCAALGQSEPALAAYQRAHELTTDPTERVEVAGKAADLLRRRGDGDRALSLLMTALDQARTRGAAAAEIQAHLRIGRVLWYQAEYKTALEHTVAGQLLARAGDDRRALADLARLEAQIATSRGDARAAIGHLESALREAERVAKPTLTGRILHELGRAAIHAGDYRRAAEALEHAIPIVRRAGEIERVAQLLNNLGAAHYFLGEWSQARDAWERFRRLCERLGDRTELVFALNNLGSLYRELGELSEAMAALDRALALATDTGHAHMAAMITANRGEVLARTGDPAGAADCYARALAEFERMGVLDDAVETERRQCELALSAGRVREALDHVVDVARRARDLSSRREEGIAHRVAAEALRLDGDLDSATWFCDRAGELLAALGARYELARLDQERGELAAARGEVGEAVRLLEAAAGEMADLGARWDLAQIRTRLRALAPRSLGSGTLIEVASNRGTKDGAEPSGAGRGLSFLLDLARAATQLPLDRVLDQALDSLLTLTGFDRGFVLLLDEDGQPTERARRTRPGSRAFAPDDAVFSGSIVRRVAATGQLLTITDMAGEVDLRQQRSVVALGLRQVMCAPMTARGRRLGVAYIDSQNLTGGAIPVSPDLFEAFTHQLALVVDSARLVAEDARKSELMGVMAHEIRNPLAAILGFAGIGLEDSSGRDPAAAELFQRIRRDGERLGRLVDNVLELVRHDTGKLEWSQAPVDMAELLGQAIDSIQPQAGAKNITVSLDAGDGGCLALGNQDRLMQVVANILGNAVKFTPQGGSIRACVRRELVSPADPAPLPTPASELRAWAPLDEPGDTPREVVRVDVTDTGPGMSAEDCRRLFERFVQGRRRRGGVGLGLYISREIIRRHGGTIWVTSTLGQGSTFSFRLPPAP